MTHSKNYELSPVGSSNWYHHHTYYPSTTNTYTHTPMKLAQKEDLLPLVSIQ